MFEVKWIFHVVLRLLFLIDGGVWSLRNLSITVPRAVLSSDGAATMRCSYDLEGAALYSIRWYRAETEFYRYVPREMPPTMVFPLPGASVDLELSDDKQVRLVNLNRLLSGDYQCEVSADAPLFHTDIRQAALTVVDPPFRAPRISTPRGSYSRSDVITANCSVDHSYPQPNISWILNGQKIAESIFNQPLESNFKERSSLSHLELTILESDHQLSFTNIGTGVNSVYQDHFVYDKQLANTNNKFLRYTFVAPPSGQFSLMCVARILDVWERQSEVLMVREDAPRPASVTGDDAADAASTNSIKMTFSFIALLLHYLL